MITSPKAQELHKTKQTSLKALAQMNVKDLEPILDPKKTTEQSMAKLKDVRKQMLKEEKNPLKENNAPLEVKGAFSMAHAKANEAPKDNPSYRS